jgi:hypothetical protein
MKLEKKKYAEIQCPICNLRFKSEKGLTLKQWKHVLLTFHFPAYGASHPTNRSEAERVIDEYFKSKGFTTKI